ncbi:MAG: RNA-dependent DNA polymerase [Lentisphaerae bacterium]|nr:RNA-dependent DNA polymerase [Lentisphaerota bacterium]
MMAKTFGNLFPRICSLENLYEAARKARKRKTRQECVERFELHRERFLRQLRDELASGTWRPSGYRTFRIYAPRERLISAAPYRDRVVHHALCNVIQPLVERRFVADTFSCRKGKGTGAARERCRLYTNRYPYVLKCDIRKFFQSVDHDALMAKLARTIRCRPTLQLCSAVVESSCDDEVPPVTFPGDTARALAGKRRGLPIGNLTSQIWGNLYLDRIDHLVKETWRAPGYARYTDDFLIWGTDKTDLWTIRERIAEELIDERLLLHDRKTRVLQCSEGVPFLGFRFFPGRAPRVLGEAKRRFEKRTRRQVSRWDRSDTQAQEIRTSIAGWCAFARYGNVRGLFTGYRARGFGLTG